ncbi:hypothetical protein KCU89_g12779, partial [Aureobasidium melanogenum]
MSSQTNFSHQEHIPFSKIEKQPLDLPQYGEGIIADTQLGESQEVFQTHIDGVDFRNVSWQLATVVFVKINFAMSILSIPAAMAALGSVGGSLSLIGFTGLNIYTALVLGDYRLEHTQCHMLADMMGNIWGRVGRELVGIQIIIARSSSPLAKSSRRQQLSTHCQIMGRVRPSSLSCLRF